MARMKEVVGRFRLESTALVGAAALALGAQSAPADNPNCTGSSLYIDAHQDDPILFQSQNMISDFQQSRCVTEDILTDGDDGEGFDYVEQRIIGQEVATDILAGLPNDEETLASWQQSTINIGNHTLSAFTNPNINATLIYEMLPDGGFHGQGFMRDGSPASNKQSLYKLIRQRAAIPSITSINISGEDQLNQANNYTVSTYTKRGLINTLVKVMEIVQPDEINIQNSAAQKADGEHADHVAGAKLALAAANVYAKKDNKSIEVIGHLDEALNNPNEADVLSPYIAQLKLGAWLDYAPYDSKVCQAQTIADVCQPYQTWLTHEHANPPIILPKP